MSINTRSEPAENQRTIAPVVLGFVLLFIVGGAALTFSKVLQLNKSAQWVAHTRRVLATTEGMLAEISEAESAERGFLLTGDQDFRLQFEQAASAAELRHTQLLALTMDNPAQQNRLRKLADALDRKIVVMREMLALHESVGDQIQVFQLLRDGTKQASQIRSLAKEVQRVENELLDARVARMRSHLWQTGLTLLVSTLLATALTAGTYYLLRRHWGLQNSSRQESALFGRKLAEMARYNERLLESTGEGIYGIDTNGRCTFINRAGALMLHGRTEDFLDHDMHDLIHHSHKDGTPFLVTECPIYQASRTGDGCRVDNEVFWTLDKKPFPVDYSSFPIFRDENRTELEGAVITFNDITASVQARDELRLARDAAEAANESKSQFLANMSHELRTPLNAVIMYSELLIEEAEDREIDDFIPDLQKIGGAGKHLLDLVNSVLDLSKIEAGKMELYLEEFTVADVVNEVTSTVDPLIKKNHNTLKVELGQQIPPMFADVTKVRQVLFNLLSNASKFTDHGTVTLTVSRDRDDQQIVFEVSDTGIGMSEEQVSRLFQPFSQADASTTRKYGGTGLGLAIIRRFTDLMGGAISVRSAEGEGTTFTVNLPVRAKEIKPVAESADAAETHPTIPSSTPAREGGPVVLVIDDDPSIRDVLMRVLVSEGIRPMTAADGAEGLRRARELRPDMIILDVMMPKVDGWSVLAALKADDSLADVPVVMHSIRDDRNLGYMLGACEYLVKPVDRERLVTVLQRHLQSDSDVVLVVDDDDVTQRLVSRTLKRQGWRVATATNGIDALAEVRREQPAAILLDLVMPKMDGFDFLEELQQNAAWTSIPVIVLTSKELTDDDRARLNGGVQRVLEKNGLNRDHLLAEVRRMVGTVNQVAVDTAAGVSTSEP